MGNSSHQLAFARTSVFYWEAFLRRPASGAHADGCGPGCTPQDPAGASLHEVGSARGRLVSPSLTATALNFFSLFFSQKTTSPHSLSLGRAQRASPECSNSIWPSLLLWLALHIYWFCTCRFNQPQIKNIRKKISEKFQKS